MGIEQAGLIKLLGISVVTDERGHRLTLVPGDSHSNSFGTVHLAVLTALAEGAAWLNMGENAMPTGLTVNFVRPTVLHELLVTDVTVISKGRTLGVADANIHQGGKVVAVFRISFLFVEKKEK